MEVIEGNLPLPRWLPPFQQGLHATVERPNPTAVNNVETLANVPLTLQGGADAYRTIGTQQSPGAMLFTVVGDVASPGVYELPLGTPLAYETMRTAGTGLGSGGFIVYDHRHCIVRVATRLSHFLAIESCGQCSACKLGCGAITDLLREIDEGRGTGQQLDAIADRLPHITHQTRCALPAGEQFLVGSLLTEYRDEFLAHLGRPCPSEIAEPVPKIEHLDEATGEVIYDPHYHRKRSDWSFAPADEPVRRGLETSMDRSVWWRRELRAVCYERSNCTALAPWSTAITTALIVVVGRWLWSYA